MKLIGAICKSTLVVGAAIVLTACNSTPKEIESLENARAAYSEASRNINLVRYAPSVLDQAHVALQKADMHWKQNEQSLKVEHYSYLVSQRIETAKLIAESEEAEREIQEMVLQRRALNQRLRDAELVKVLKEASDLKKKMQTSHVKDTDRGMTWTLGDVFFDVGKASLAPSAARNIAQIASYMRKNPEQNAVIEGHTDASGDDDYNMELSNKRAMTVRDALQDANIDASRLSVSAFGENRPVAKNTSMVGKQANRRVEILFVDQAETPLQMTEFEDM